MGDLHNNMEEAYLKLKFETHQDAYRESKEIGSRVFGDILNRQDLICFTMRRVYRQEDDSLNRRLKMHLTELAEGEVTREQCEFFRNRTIDNIEKSEEYTPAENTV